MVFFEVNAQCRVERVNCAIGEELRYNVSYNWGFIWVDGGEVIFRVEDGGPGRFKITGEGRTYPSRDWIFSIRDQYVSIIDQGTMMPYYAYRNNREGTIWCEHKYFFDYSRQKVYTEVEEANVSFSRDTLSLTGCVLDLQTAVYIVRSRDFSSLKVNEKIPLQVLIANQILPLYFRYLGKVNLRVHETGIVYRCHKFKVNLIAGSMFKEGENMTVWVTDDKNKIPIQFEAEILVGSVKAMLRSNKGQKYQLNAIVTQ